jgi:hypothetical protein
MKIAILGTAKTSIAEAPFADAAWEIWSLGGNQGDIPRADKWFELHDQDVLKQVGIAPTAVDFLRNQGANSIVQKQCEMFPNATPYPLEEVITAFPRGYFTSSIAWILAMAILQNPEEIGLWGVDMVGADEYEFQKACCEYFIGIAEGRGIKVIIAKDSPLCRSERLYAFMEQGISRELVIRRRELKAETERRKAELERLNSDYHFFRGRHAEAEDISNRWR